VLFKALPSLTPYFPLAQAAVIDIGRFGMMHKV